MRKREVVRLIKLKQEQIDALNFAIMVLNDICIEAFKQELVELKKLTGEKPAKKTAKNSTLAKNAKVVKTAKKKGK